MSLHSHIKELRMRLFVVAAAFIVFSSLAYVFRDPIIHVLLLPLHGEQLSYLNPGGGFGFIFKVSMWFGIALSLPLFLYAIYTFIAPALPVSARKQAPVVLVASTLLLICGALFGYVYAIPGAMRFLLEFADEYVQAMLTADSYLNFVLAYTVGLGILFQIPLLMMIVHWITPLGPKKLLSFERYVIVVAFIAAAIITPTPDMVNQAIIAAPIVLMYQIGVVAVCLSIWRRSRRAVSEKQVTQKMPTQRAVEHGELDVDSLLSTLPSRPTAVRQVSTQPLLNRRRTVGGEIAVRRRPSEQVQPAPVAAAEPIQPVVRQARRSIDGVIRYSAPRTLMPST